MSLSELAAKHETSINVDLPAKSGGLSDAEAAKRLEIYGLNQMTPPKTISALMQFLLKARRGSSFP